MKVSVRIPHPALLSCQLVRDIFYTDFHTLVAVDVRLAIQVELLLQNMTLVLFCLAVVSAVFPWFLLSVIPLAAFFYIINRISRLGITGFYVILGLNLELELP